MKKAIYLLILLLVDITISVANTHTVTSPDGRLNYEVVVGDKISFALYYKGSAIIDNSEFGLQFSESRYLGIDMDVINSSVRTINESWEPVTGQYAKIKNHANELTLTLREIRFPGRELTLTLRAYDDGVAFRYHIPKSFEHFVENSDKGGTIRLLDEKTIYNFQGDYRSWVINYGSYDTDQEKTYYPMKMSDIAEDAIVGMPLLLKTTDEVYIALTEANLTNWAGMYLKSVGPKKVEVDLADLHGGGGKVNVVPGSDSPWRVLMVGEQPGDLIESSILYNLNEPCAIEDPSWIKPGISAWDHWWSHGSRMDTKSIMEYIDLAAEMGWEYMLIDWKWYGLPFEEDNWGVPNPHADITTVIPELDMPKVIDYANYKNVSLILWLLWWHADKQLNEAFPLYEKWGIKGVKIDFMARDDQEMVKWYHKVVKKAAEHHLIVDFHGAYKPTGWERTYPNLLTREGVLGNEYSKWSSLVTPEHTTTIPFTRMITGHMDYTPGAFINKAMGQFRVGSPAQAMGTRCNQLAMFVVYYSPLTVACDHPDRYKNQPGIEFLKQIPTVWDDTKVLNGEIGEYITMARKNDGRWFIGAMNNSEARTLTISLEFLDKGTWELHYFKDANDAHIHAENLEVGKMDVEAASRLTLEMAPGGGYAAYLEKK